MGTPAGAITCRHVLPGDADKLGELFGALRAGGDEATFHPHPLDAEGANAISAYAGRDEYYVAEREGELVGYAMLRGWDAGYEVPSLGIAVAPGARAAGVGEALMAFMHERARLRGAAAVRLKVYPDNHAAIALYRRMGYVFAEGTEDGQLMAVLSL